jgi:DNA sulfur modification protein DndB
MRRATETKISFPALRITLGPHQAFACTATLRQVLSMLDVGDIVVHPLYKSSRHGSAIPIQALSRQLKRSLPILPAELTASLSGGFRFNPGPGQSASGELELETGVTIRLDEGDDLLLAMRDLARERLISTDQELLLTLCDDPAFEHSNRIASAVARRARLRSRSVPIAIRADRVTRFTHRVSEQLPLFKGRIEMHRSTISNRSKKLFTFSALRSANNRLLSTNIPAADRRTARQNATRFWRRLASTLPAWIHVADGTCKPFELRQNSLAGHGLFLQATAELGRALMEQYPQEWEVRVQKLSDVDLSRTGPLGSTLMAAGRLGRKEGDILELAAEMKRHLAMT